MPCTATASRQHKSLIKVNLGMTDENDGESSGSSSEVSRRKLPRPECLNTLEKLQRREIGGFPRSARGYDICSPERFRNFQLQEEFNTYDRSIFWFFKLQFFKKRTEIIEIIGTDDVIFALSKSGLCAAFSRTTNKRICFLNMYPDEVIRSIFYNKNNEALITVSAYASDHFTSLKCKTTPLQNIRRNQLDVGQPIFESESLRWPGFIEFDEVNGKALVYAAQDCIYKVFDLKDYSLLYSIDDPNIQEIRLSPGLMLLLYKTTRSRVPITLRSIEDGKVLKSFKHLLDHNKKIDFIEQFNEKLLIKQENEKLQILDVVKSRIIEVANDELVYPAAFVFLYDSHLFLSFRNKMVQVWNFQGDLVNSFPDTLLWHPDCDTNNLYITNEQDLIISYCKAGKEGEAPLGSIRMSNILTGKCMAELSPRDPSLKIAPRKRGHPNRSTIHSTIIEALDDITALYYDEDKNEIFTGNRNGLVHLWSN